MVLIIAHRGASAYEPENTIKAVRRAWELGAPMVEVDVRLCKDGEVVVIHDETLDRTTNASGYVRDLNLEELRRVDAGKGERIPTLDEVLEFAKGRLKVVIELKEVGLEDKVVNIVQHHEFEDDAVVVSFLHPSVRAVKERASAIKTGIIFKGLPIDPLDLVSKAKADSLFIYHKHITEGLVQGLHEKGLKVFAWTVDEKSKIQNLIDMGIDGVATNRPDILSSASQPIRTKKVFISGPIHGMERHQTYRKLLERALKEHGYDVIDPWEREKVVYFSKKKEWWKDVPIKGFIQRDLEDVQRCDLLVAYLPRLSAGTCMELYEAKRLGKKTFVISRRKDLSPWILVHTDGLYRSLSEFMDALRSGHIC